MTFKEYLLSLHPKQPRLPKIHLTWNDKEVGATIGGGMVGAFGIGFAVVSGNPLFLLILIPMPLLIHYGIYCNKKENGELE